MLHDLTSSYLENRKVCQFTAHFSLAGEKNYAGTLTVKSSKREQSMELVVCWHNS